MTRARRPASRRSKSVLTVRMYNVGFGDCFLLIFPAPDRPRKVLVDCGVHPAGHPKPVPFPQVVEAVVADVKEEGGPRIDVVVCSHRHRDHVLGFESPLWGGVRVDEVWMPWTEDPTDAEARRIREVQAKKARELALALHEMRRLGHIDQTAFDRIHPMAVNSDLTNAKAMEMLHGGFRGKPEPRFLPERSAAGGPSQRRFETKALPGVRVHVLGPSRNRDVIRDMEPPSDESFLRLARAADGELPAQPPFPMADWALSPAGDAFGPWFETFYTRAKGLKPDAPIPPGRPRSDEFAAAWLKSIDLTRADITRLDHLTEDDALLAAVAIDKAVNGTSLVLLFEVGKTLLLFPGDAQWGTWNEALQDPEWSQLLSRLRFLKVGHHGSHNATPRSLVKLLGGSRPVAMVPTRETKRYDDIPRKPLLHELGRTTTALARSDQGTVAAPFRRVSPVAIEIRLDV